MKNTKLQKYYPWIVVALLWVVALLNYMDRQMLSTMRESIIGKTKCDGIQNQMRLFGGRVSPKRKRRKFRTRTQKSTVRMAFDCRSNGVLHQVEPMPAPPHSPKYPPSNRDACARSS